MNGEAILQAVATGEASAREVCEAAIAGIEATDGVVNAFTDRTFMRARAEAEAAAGAQDISHHGGWRAYLAAQAASAR